MDRGARDPGTVRGPDPTAPDIEGARRRYPDWTFWREGKTWRARRADESSQLTGLSLESLEGQVARAEKARAARPAPKCAGEGGPPGDAPSPALAFAITQTWAANFPSFGHAVPINVGYRMKRNLHGKC
jgi:hypothetical protein